MKKILFSVMAAMVSMASMAALSETYQFQTHRANLLSTKTLHHLSICVTYRTHVWFALCNRLNLHILRIKKSDLQNVHRYIQWFGYQ